MENRVLTMISGPLTAAPESWLPACRSVPWKAGAGRSREPSFVCQVVWILLLACASTSLVLGGALQVQLR